MSNDLIINLPLHADPPPPEPDPKIDDKGKTDGSYGGKGSIEKGGTKPGGGK